MDFTVNGTQYLIAYDSAEESWMLLTPGKDGFRKLEVYGDAPLPGNVVAIQTTPVAQKPVN